ncbi:YciI family protein [Leifsonia shinshuensis]
MTKFMISFPGSAMHLTEEELPAVSDAAHSVIREAQDAGVYVFGGGIDEGAGTVLVSGDGTVSAGTYPETRLMDGGFTILDLPTRDAALEWAAKIATACRCAQEVREFQYDPLA